MSDTSRFSLRTLLLLIGWLPGFAFADDAKELEAEFETRVRPVLVAHCQSCHGAKKQEAGLRLDSAAGLKNGSDSGPVVVPGNVEQSLLIQAVRHTGNTKMPPKQKLSDAEIAALTKWVQRGAVWPVDAVGSGTDNAASIRQRTQTHWAFQPVRQPARRPSPMSRHL